MKRTVKKACFVGTLFLSVIFFSGYVKAAVPLLVPELKWFPGDNKILLITKPEGKLVLISTDTASNHVVENGEVKEASISPDGYKVVYSIQGKGIWVVNADGSEKTQITTDDGFNLIWSPGGIKISYMLFTEKGISIYVVHFDGSNKKLVYQ
ncbi:MAG: hypothetical protein HY746_05090 [Elusimicrobia bacterium]|nr:hypothetical protein [Elusimicrobiota bacterium]